MERKLTKPQKWLRTIRRRARRSLAARRRFKKYLLERRKKEAGLSRQDLAIIHRQEHRAVKHVRVKAPALLSFVRNPEGVSHFISQLRYCFDKRKPVWVVLQHVKDIDYDGITVLLSVMVRYKSKRIEFNGDFPLDKGVRQTLEDSKFFDHLLKSRFRDEDSYDLKGQSSIVTHAMKTVDSELGEKIIESASETVWGVKRRCPGVQRTFIELMQNTNNHASLEKEGDKHWWLSVKKIPNENRVAFSFVDYGVGVFHNLKNKRLDNKFYGVLERLYERFRYGNNADVLKLIFLGELHKTASGKPFRGKGLPGIYEALQGNKLSNFAMITNNVFFHSQGNEYRILNNEFQGTFVYWEITTSNDSLPYEN